LNEDWEVGQHPAVPNGWIVRPVLLGSRAYALPECEGGHIVLRSKEDAYRIAALPALLNAARAFVEAEDALLAELREEGALPDLTAAPWSLVDALRHAVALAEGKV
jgi:hypothetical protein